MGLLYTLSYQMNYFTKGMHIMVTRYHSINGTARTAGSMWRYRHTDGAENQKRRQKKFCPRLNTMNSTGRGPIHL